jgi:hypothetical protein
LATFLSLLGVALYIVAIISLAAAITWGVVKLFPPKTPEQKSAKPS